MKSVSLKSSPKILLTTVSFSSSAFFFAGVSANAGLLTDFCCFCCAGTGLLTAFSFRCGGTGLLTAFSFCCGGSGLLTGFFCCRGSVTGVFTDFSSWACGSTTGLLSDFSGGDLLRGDDVTDKDFSTPAEESLASLSGIFLSPKTFRLCCTTAFTTLSRVFSSITGRFRSKS